MLFKYMKREEEPRARRVLEFGLFSTNQLKEFIRTRLASINSRTYTHMSFDHIISWTMDEKHDYGLFCKTVIMGEWDHDFPRYSRLYLESNR